ncbi:MAG: hypothetical protein FWE48_05205 [Coriobacteriia bacterium]|nr:hypothetical protein [Coriobacteriia bacterium]MCL2746466.1 hypothetical protein [Coriobacteriia bacterium]MCL2870740.1 hypothetical protein [Coriobacteriia bacterium]
MSGTNLIIQVKKSAKRLLLIAALVFGAIGYGTANIFGVEGELGTIVLVSTFLSVFLVIVWINANFERLTFEGDEVRYRYFLFVQRRAKKSEIEEITIGERSGRLRLYVNGRRFASLNFGVIDITEDELESYAKKLKIPVKPEDDKQGR